MVINKKYVCMLIACLAAFLLAGDATAQIVYGQPASGRIGFVYTHWKLDTDFDSSATISQLWFPVSAFVPLRDNLEARLFFSTSSNTVSAGEIDADAVGTGDLQVQISKSLMRDRFLLSVGFNLPTGKTELELGGERPIIQALSESYLDFPSRRYGSGFGFNVLSGFAAQSGSAGIAGSLMFEYKGKYTPYAAATDYNPGDVLTGNFGVHWPGETTNWGINLGFGLYTNDKADSEKVFRQSPYGEVRLSNDYRQPKYTLSSQIRFLMRGKNKVFNEEGAEIVSEKLYGNELLLSSRMKYRVSPDWFIGPLALYRYIGSNDLGFGSSYTVKVGAMAGAMIGASSQIEFDIRYLMGRADGGSIDLTGVQINSGLLVAF